MPHPLLIICFGDSLTAGFQSPTRENPGGKETPYGNFLQESLGGIAEVRVSGICGQVTAEMVGRFQRDVVDHKPDYVPILGGTNDLGWATPLQDIMRNLFVMYEHALACGSTPIAVTIPSIRIEGTKCSREELEWVADHLARRSKLNRSIREYAASKSIPCVDLFGITAEPADGQLAASYSNDGIHLTTAGYRIFAELVTQVLKTSMS